MWSKISIVLTLISIAIGIVGIFFPRMSMPSPANLPFIHSTQLVEQNIATGTSTEILFETDDLSLSRNWIRDGEDDGKYYAPRKGYYYANWTVYWQSNCEDGEIYSWAAKNGDDTVDQGEMELFVNNGYTSSTTGSGKFYMNGTTDYISVWVYQDSGIHKKISSTVESAGYETSSINITFAHE